MAGTNFYGTTSDSDLTAGIAFTDEKDLAMVMKSALGGATPATTAGLYAKGCQYVDTTQTAGVSPMWLNIGTVASPSWSPVSTTATEMVRSATVSLTSVNIKALNATPITLVAAQGAGTTIVVHSVVFKFTAGTQYANGGSVEFRYTNASGAKVTGADLAAGVITSASSSITVLGNNSSAAVTAVANAPIVVCNATAPYITGTGTATVTVYYSVV